MDCHRSLIASIGNTLPGRSAVEVNIYRELGIIEYILLKTGSLDNAIQDFSLA